MAPDVYEKLVASACSLIKSDRILDCAIGTRCVGVHSTNGVGLAFLPDGTYPSLSGQDTISRMEDSFKGMDLSALIPRYLDDDPFIAVLALAAINSLLIHKGKADPQNWFTRLRGKKKLCMVGYFCPIMDRIALTNIETIIFELKDIPGTHSPKEAATLTPQCDIVLITGASFANKTVHTYLPHINPDAEAFIVGHSTPLADFLLEAFTLGSSRVMNTNAVLTAIRQGAGMHGMKRYLHKVIRQKKI